MTTTPMKFSIVITCFNYARYVGGAIEAALAQTHPDVEVVVVDDGSTDESAQVIGAYEGRVRSIRQVNQGSIAAYNRGYLESSGDLVLFLDADDLVAPTVAAECVAAWRAGAVKVQFDLTIINALGEDLGRRFCNYLPDYDAAAVRASFARTGTYRWPVTVGNAYARSYLEKMMPLTVAHGPDGLLNTVAPVYGDVITIARCLGSYRLHGSNQWSSNGRDLGRLPERIRDRRREIGAMVAHAAARGVAVPRGDVLDHELAFINYRLTARRLGQAYAGDERDTAASLWASGMRFLRHNRMPLRVKFAHAAWLTTLGLVPSALAGGLIRLRANRTKFVQPIRRALGQVQGAVGLGRQPTG